MKYIVLMIAVTLSVLACEKKDGSSNAKDDPCDKLSLVATPDCEDQTTDADGGEDETDTDDSTGSIDTGDSDDTTDTDDPADTDDTTDTDDTGDDSGETDPFTFDIEPEFVATLLKLDPDLKDKLSGEKLAEAFAKTIAEDLAEEEFQYLLGMLNP